jgi:acyl transferase domain-containing protein/acetyltransferase-like isoleucine patch superfamily enzyme
MGNNFYYLYNVLTRPDKLALMGDITAEIANEKDHIAPRISHKLNLAGPSLSVHAACATTLVVIDSAYQALVSHQVDVALAGGVDIRTPQKSGQRYEEGGVFSIDGHCRPFDASASGTMFGEGVGALVLKRLDDAVRDGDTIHAVIKGAAVNHDGGHKVSYLAPSVEGQARVIAAALGIADVHPDTITYVEGHGTATPIGDPIEVEALTRVYRNFTQRRHYCAIGSIKGNFGHATTAAGVAGVLKVVLALQHGKIPATLHFATPNPRIDFATSPFFVAAKLLDWAPQGMARRASVSAFGFCGTNAHVILEEAPQAPVSSPPSRPAQLVLMSARSRAALDATAEHLSSALKGASPADLADMAYTTHVGRKRHEHRRCAILLGSEDDAVTLTQAAGARSASLESDAGHPPVAFMFPGQGSQYVDMGLRLYQGEPLFRQVVDHCAATLSAELGCDLRNLLFPDAASAERARESLDSTRFTQPAIFVLSYALASLYRRWGIEPSAFIGHSIGEFVAATLCGVMELDDALRLVAARGRLMQALPSGSMLSVRLPMEALVQRLPAGVDLAAENGPQLCVVAGPSPRVAALRDELSAEGVACRMLRTSHAFHSSMMDPAVEPFLRVVEGVRLSPPQLPFVSTVTGDWIGASQATDPAYWARHLRSPVQFSKAVRVLLQDSARVLLECGPRHTCAALALQQGPARPGRIIASMPDSAEPDDEYPSVLLALGSLWLNGCTIDWSAYHERETRRRRALPTYPFQRRRFWIEPGNTVSFGVAGAGTQPSVTVLEQGETSRVTDAPARDAGSEQDRTTASVVMLLEELLGHRLDGFDEDARFIALGLDSLLLTQLARGVRTRLGFEVTFRQLSERLSTTKLLSDAIRSSPAAARSTTNGTPAIRTGPVAAPTADPSRAALSTTPTQLEMWLSSQASPEAACACNASFTVNLSGAVDDGALVRALRALPERHAALRGHYGAGGEQFLIEPRLDVEVPRYDLSKLSPARRAEALRQLAEQDARTPYDAERGPLFRAAFVELGPGERAVLLGAHQGACDGWSLDVLLEDLGRLYSAFAGRAPTPAPAQHDLRDYLTLRASPAYADKLASSRDFWRKSLEALPPSLDLPHDGRLLRVRSPRVDHALRVVPQAVIDPIKAFARAQGVSFFSVLLSGYAVLLQRLSGATDSIVGIPVAGHPDAGMEDCVGCLASVVPLRLRVDPQQSFLDLCRATSASVLDAREHAVMGFGEIAAAVALPPDPVRLPPLAVTFTHVQKHEPGKLPFEGCSVGYYMNPRVSQMVDLDLNVVQSEDALELRLHGNSGLYSRQWLDGRLRELEQLLDSACRWPQTPVSGLTIPHGDEVRPRPLAAVARKSDPGPNHGAGHPAAPASAWRPYITILRGASRSLATAYKLRDCADVGAGSRVVGRVWIHGEGRIVIGQRVLLDGSRAPIELHPEHGAEIVIGDDVVLGGGTSIEATHSVSIGPRTRVDAGCKIMDSHFHMLDDRLERPPARAVVVEEDVQLGRNVILTAGAHVGRGTIVEARTVVGGPIGPDALARGIPAKIHGQGGSHAHRR